MLKQLNLVAFQADLNDGFSATVSPRALLSMLPILAS